MLKAVILGSGAAIPTKERGLSSVGLRFAGRVYLFDCGEGTQRQMMRFGMSFAKVDSIFVSHSHADHIVGIAGLAQTLDLSGRREPLRIFCPKGAAGDVEALLSIGKYGYPAVVSEIGEGAVLEGNGFSVKAFQVAHSRPSLGFVFEEEGRRNFDEKKCAALGIKGRMFGELEAKGEIRVGGKTVKYESVSTAKRGAKFAYSGDCVPGKGTVAAARGAHVLVHEATYASDKEEEAREHLHSTAAQAAAVAKKAGAGRLVLTHISGRYKTPELHLLDARKVFPETVAAEDGMELVF
ncbi:MAG: ribonuclease Z [Candidatus ainarchaeum sp.]|nr:ribonuclease Z [Candidatus ainarchaeum sp.]